MTDVEIRSCVVRVVRRGGWSWGADPRALVDDVVAAVPRLIEEALRDVVPPTVDGEVTEPIRVRVPVREADLREFAAPGRGGSPGPAAGPVERQVTAALRAALERAGVVGPLAPPHAMDAPRPAARPIGSPPSRAPGQVVLGVLGALEHLDRLPAVLDRLPEPVLAAWHRALVEGWRSASAGPPDDGELRAAAEQVPVPAGRPPRRAGWLRARITAMTVIAGRVGVPPGHPAVQGALRARFGPEPTEATVATAPEEVPLQPPAALPVQPEAQEPPPPITAAPARRIAPPSSRATPRARWDASALPYLVLAQLARIGWIDALEAGVAAADLTDNWPALAAALAFTVLDEPEHAWRRSDRDLTTAAAFACAGAPFVERALPPGGELVAPVLDAVLRANLVAGHRPGDPLLIVQVDDGAVLFDGAGLFPMAWAARPDDLAETIDACPDSRVIADVDDALVVRATEVLAALGRRAASPWTSQPTQPGVERSFTLAAGAALAALGWELWGAHEPTDPLLTLERLRSLEAVVHDGASAVRVVLPLGARYFALHERGLLGDVPGVPWLDGRTVEIVGG